MPVFYGRHMPLKNGDDDMKRTLIQITAVIILTALFCFGTNAMLNEQKNSEKTTQNSTTAVSKTSSSEYTTNPNYEYKPITISDDRLAYYGIEETDLSSNKNASVKPNYKIDNYGKITSFVVRLTPETVNWGEDTLENANDSAFTARYITGKNFIYFDSDAESIFITDYAYDNAFYPCKQTITDYVKNTGNSVIYQINFEYDIPTMTLSCPKQINIKAYSVEDKGKSLNFSLFIFNYDKNRVVDRVGVKWSQTSQQ